MSEGVDIFSPRFGSMLGTSQRFPPPFNKQMLAMNSHEVYGSLI